MSKIIKLALLLITIVISFSCKHAPPKQYLSKGTYASVVEKFPDYRGKPLLIYYFDGDCSLCLAKVRFIMTDFLKDKELMPVFIARTLNPEILSYNIRQLDSSPRVYIEKNNEFQSTLKFNYVFELDTDDAYVPFDIK